MAETTIDNTWEKRGGDILASIDEQVLASEVQGTENLVALQVNGILPWLSILPADMIGDLEKLRESANDSIHRSRAA